MPKQSNGFDTEFGRFFKSLIYMIMLALLGFALFIVLAMFRISSQAFNTYDSLDDLPHNEVGLLLGTSSYTRDGNRNPFFVNRIRAAVLLYKEGKIDYILVSGDNRHESYNEPRQMMHALMKEGVPRDRIVADFAGFSTIDSVARASRVFMLKKVTIISQSFHNERALFLAEHEGLKAIGFNASDPVSKWRHFKVYIREFFARLKCVLDVYFLDTQPTFLGNPIKIGDNPLPKAQSNKPKVMTSLPKEVSDRATAVTADGRLRPIVEPKEQSDAAIIIKQRRAAEERLKRITPMH